MAFLAAAPEVAAVAEGSSAAEAGGAAGSARFGRRKGKGKGKGRKLTPGTSPADVNEELQRRRQEAADAKNTPPAPPAPTATATATSAPMVDRMDAIHTGSGAALAVVGWVVFMNFMQGGMPQVRKWGAAKFLNKTGG